MFWVGLSNLGYNIQRCFCMDIAEQLENLEKNQKELTKNVNDIKDQLRKLEEVLSQLRSHNPSTIPPITTTANAK